MIVLLNLRNSKSVLYSEIYICPSVMELQGYINCIHVMLLVLTLPQLRVLS